MLKRLKKGDEIEIVAPASYIEDVAKFKLGIDILEKWGLRINKNVNINRVFKSKEINLKKISNHFKNQAIYGGLILGALIIA